jgi:transposase, IS5 family
MYQQVKPDQKEPEKFPTPFESQLAADNRWVIMSKLIQWDEFEQEYAQNFSSGMGAPAKPFRMALGALIIKEKLGTSDRETVEQIKENPYLQYFIGLDRYYQQAPFDPSMLVHFRQRIGEELVKEINQRIVKEIREVLKEEAAEKKHSQEAQEKVKENQNSGRLIVDATCAPADVKYPNDLGLLASARAASEKIVDTLDKKYRQPGERKVRTYREQARKEYLKVAKQRRPTAAVRRKAIKKQLQYIKRNLAHIEGLLDKSESIELNRKQHRQLLIIKEVERQQSQMYQNQTQKIEDRIVSIHQPHVRPIVRGKAVKSVEFGAKISASCRDNYVFLDKISWDNYNESGDLIDQIEAFKKSQGCYPESVHADKIYRTRANRAWCKERGIRLSGPPLGRPKKMDAATKKQAQADERIRNQIEGKFGVAKRRFSLGRVMTKLSQTSETAISITFLVMNLSLLLRQLMKDFFGCFLPHSVSSSLRLKIFIQSPFSLTKADLFRSSFTPLSHHCCHP